MHPPSGCSTRQKIHPSLCGHTIHGWKESYLFRLIVAWGSVRRRPLTTRSKPRSSSRASPGQCSPPSRSPSTAKVAPQQQLPLHVMPMMPVVRAMAPSVVRLALDLIGARRVAMETGDALVWENGAYRGHILGLRQSGYCEHEC